MPVAPTTQLALPATSQFYAWSINWIPTFGAGGVSREVGVLADRVLAQADGSSPLRVGPPISILPCRDHSADPDPDLVPINAAIASFDPQIRAFITALGQAPASGQWTFLLQRFPVYAPAPAGITIGLKIFVLTYTLDGSAASKTGQTLAYQTKDLGAETNPAAVSLSATTPTLDAIIQTYVTAKAK